MKPELQKELYDKYPKIFRQKDLPMTETCMCWGIDVGDGWFKIIDTLCSLIQWDVDKNGRKQVEAVQVKEKYGTLRFYIEPFDERFEAMIDMAEGLSAKTCEECSDTTTAKLRDKRAWIRTLCDKCNEVSRSGWKKE